jgi:hypothetical protein
VLSYLLKGSPGRHVYPCPIVLLRYIFLCEKGFRSIPVLGGVETYPFQDGFPGLGVVFPGGEEVLVFCISLHYLIGFLTSIRVKKAGDCLSRYLRLVINSGR